MVVVVSLCTAGFALTASAAMDETQHLLSQRVAQAKQVQQQALAAKGEERQKLLSNHMKLMHEHMEACRAMKPKADLTEKERDEWYVEQQKIMNQMMDQMMIQMMADARLLSEHGGSSMESGMHKH